MAMHNKDLVTEGKPYCAQESFWAIAFGSHSAPFCAVLKQLWQRLLKRGEDERYTDNCIRSHLLFPWYVVLHHHFLHTARPLSAPLG